MASLDGLVLRSRYLGFGVVQLFRSWMGLRRVSSHLKLPPAPHKKQSDRPRGSAAAAAKLLFANPEQPFALQDFGHLFGLGG